MSEFPLFAPRRLMLVDPCRECQAVRPGLQARGWHVETASLGSLRHSRGDIALLRLDERQLRQPQRISARIRDSGMLWIAVLPSPLLSHPAVAELIGQWFFDFHTLPLDRERLLFCLGHALGMAALRQRPAAPASAAVQPLLGRSPGMRGLRRRIGELVSSEAHVLICAEPGTGKTLLAKTLHARSPRAAGPFITLDVENSDTAWRAAQEAVRRAEAMARPGLGVTLFCKEIAALPLDAQARLVQGLQATGCSPAASTARPRLLAASAYDLSARVRAGRFRADLLACIEEPALLLPPLRERRADIGVLAHYFAWRCWVVSGRSSRPFSELALVALREHSWPGNVSELLDRIQRARWLAGRRQIEPADLGLDARVARGSAVGRLEHYLFQAERQALDAALTRHADNLSQAARVLGVSRPTFYRLLHKHQLR
ncbi:MAG: sigma 54-interacting transcriptional regulator [Pseudomonas sp.]|uniref:sigma-54-dependent transcriptional regulator n=1 Tax=Pseudomonas sp. TaxID=306 RepID=UPI0033914834